MQATQSFAPHVCPGERGSVCAKRARLSAVERAFHSGLTRALVPQSSTRLAARLEALLIERERRGFVYEGAGMGLALWDALAPRWPNWNRGPRRSSRLAAFSAGAGRAHVYLLYVGAGWVAARLRRDPARAMAGLDPLLGWLVLDGYGFHEGYFRARRVVQEQRAPARISGQARRVFDQGLGRSLWFTCGAEVECLARSISAFSIERRADLWSGVGLACAYAGAVESAEIERLGQLAAGFELHLAQGAVFAAAARARAANPAPHTQLACQVLCGLGAGQAAELAERALVDLPRAGSECAYLAWRANIREQLRAHREGRGG